MQKEKLVRKFLILVLLVGLVLAGRFIGNALRQPFRERQYLLESLSVDEFRIFQENAPQIIERIPVRNWNVLVRKECKDDVYYTSFPAKCQTVDGRLIEVGNDELDMILTPWLDDPEE